MPQNSQKIQKSDKISKNPLKNNFFFIKKKKNQIKKSYSLSFASWGHSARALQSTPSNIRWLDKKKIHYEKRIIEEEQDTRG